MRTLRTQVRLRRLIRVHGELLDRLAAEPGDRELRLAAAARLRDLASDVGIAWTAEAAVHRPTAELAVCDAHVKRALRAIDAALAELRRTPAGVDWLRAQFRAAAVPLLLFLRGLEETPEDLLEGWLAPALPKSA